MIKTAEKIVRKIFNRPKLVLEDSFPEITPSDIAIINQVKDYTLTPAERLWGLLNAVRYITREKIEGDFVELGVWRGGSSMAAALEFKRVGSVRKIWMYDTFEGMSEPTSVDRKSGPTSDPAIVKWQKTRLGEGSDWCRASLNDVRQNMEKTGYPNHMIQFVVGKAENTLSDCKPDLISILRIDTDWHAPTKAAMEQLYGRLAVGGVLILDDYGSWVGARLAVDEYFAAKGSMPLMVRLDRGARILVKVAG